MFLMKSLGLLLVSAGMIAKLNGSNKKRQKIEKEWVNEWNFQHKLIENAINDVNEAEHDDFKISRAYAGIDRISKMQELLETAKEKDIITIAEIKDAEIQLERTWKSLNSVIQHVTVQKLEYGSDPIPDDYTLDFDDLLS